MKKVKVLGFDIFNDSFDVIHSIEGKILINTISPNSYTISRRNILFKKALQASDIITLDGYYFNLASKLLGKISIPKKSGTDWFYYLMNYYNCKAGRIFFLGSTKNILEKIENRSKKEYMNLITNSFNPPFKEDFDKDDLDKIITKINIFSPDVVFIGLTAPKQEILAFQLINHIDAKIVCTIGNVFDWFAGVQKQPGRVWVKLKLEWLIRTIRRPEILKRYPNIFYFFWILFLNVIKLRKD